MGKAAVTHEQVWHSPLLSPTAWLQIVERLRAGSCRNLRNTGGSRREVARQANECNRTTQRPSWYSWFPQESVYFPGKSRELGLCLPVVVWLGCLPMSRWRLYVQERAKDLVRRPRAASRLSCRWLYQPGFSRITELREGISLYVYTKGIY